MFFNSNGNVGNIQTSGTATSYITSSDPRLKDFLEKPSDARINEKFNSIYESFELFNWKADESKSEVWGFNAHTAIDLDTGIGFEGGDRDKELGDNVNPAGVDQSKAVPVLVAKIEQLERRLKLVENK